MSLTEKIIEIEEEPKCILNESGIFLECNESITNLFQIEKDKIIGKNIKDLSSPFQPHLQANPETAFNNIYKQFIDSSESSSFFKWVFLRKDQKEFWINIFVKKIQNEEKINLEFIFKKEISNEMNENQTNPKKEEEKSDPLLLEIDSQEVFIFDETEQDWQQLMEDRIEIIKETIRPLENFDLESGMNEKLENLRYIFIKYSTEKEKKIEKISNDLKEMEDEYNQKYSELENKLEERMNEMQINEEDKNSKNYKEEKVKLEKKIEEIARLLKKRQDITIELMSKLNEK
ncbi:hypothetical protein M0811_00122 [Anaeramoeba ignava]|uniref:PAS domain-containing protein n=1 Tax=Anaeramoeba ignava TaxID=1746090 RepID=A0A9Q0LT50_ANAIG|nr:hypothetical protein M0811_00122 [Anaeramoeba ignava]